MKKKRLLYSVCLILLLVFGGVFILVKYSITKGFFFKEINNYSVYTVYNPLGQQNLMCGTYLVRKTETKEKVARFRLCENNIVDVLEKDNVLTVKATCGKWERNLKTGEEKVYEECLFGSFSKE